MYNTYKKKKILIVNLQGNANKTIIRYHLTDARKVIIKKTGNEKCWQESGGQGALEHYLWENKLVHSLQETVWRFPK